MRFGTGVWGTAAVGSRQPYLLVGAGPGGVYSNETHLQKSVDSRGRGFASTVEVFADGSRFSAPALSKNLYLLTITFNSVPDIFLRYM